MQAPRTTIKNTWDERLIQGVLKTIRFCRSASPAQLGALTRQCWTLEVKRGETVVSKAARPQGAFAVAHGTVKLALRRSDGEERVTRLVQAGETFGESSALLGRAALIEAIAVTDCKLVVIPTAAIFTLIESDPRCARQMLLSLAERNIELLSELESSSMQKGAQRLALYLDGLAQPRDSNGGWIARLPVTKTVVASRLGMKKETLSRLLRTFAELGLIEVAQREIGILDRARLAEVAALPA
jgi:CRP-like cAMP-binding protein